MSKRSVENSIDGLSEDLLGDLSPAERQTLTLEAFGEDRDEHVEYLRSTCPTSTYRAIDLEYFQRMQFLQLLASYAIHDLQKHIIHFRRTEVCNRYRERLEALHDTHDVDSELPFRDRFDHPDFWARCLDGSYRGCERFATEDLEVSLDEWFSISRRGPTFLERAEMILATHETASPTYSIPEGVPEVESPEAGADRTYQALHDMWSETF